MKLGPLTLFERKDIGVDVDTGDPLSDPVGPLLIRWILVRVPLFGIYLHKLCRSDYDRALHDHPWPFVSIVLWGGYWEVHDQSTQDRPVWLWRGAGSVAYRPADWRHRIVLNCPAWTLILVGRRCRPWGFWLPEGWCWWRHHNAGKNICEDHIVNTHGRD